MNATCTASLLTRWRRSFGARRRRYSHPRRLAGLGYLANGPALEGLIELENLVLAVLYDEPEAHGRTATWLAGFGGVLGPWGVRWGGPQENRFLKDFSLRPEPDARGRRPDSGRDALLRLALELDAKIERYVRYPRVAGRYRLRLPKLWAGFRRSRAAQIAGDGPELADACRRSGKPAGQLMEQSRRAHEGLTLFPLPWVSHHWELASAVFVDLAPFPAAQVFPLKPLPEGLQGFQAAAEYDFYTSRFRAPKPRDFAGAPPAPAVKAAG